MLGKWKGKPVQNGASCHRTALELLQRELDFTHQPRRGPPDPNELAQPGHDRVGDDWHVQVGGIKVDGARVELGLRQHDLHLRRAPALDGVPENRETRRDTRSSETGTPKPSSFEVCRQGETDGSKWTGNGRTSARRHEPCRR